MQFGAPVALIPHCLDLGYHLAARHSDTIEARPAEDILQFDVAKQVFEQEIGDAGMATASVLCALSQVMGSAVGLCDLL